VDDLVPSWSTSVEQAYREAVTLFGSCFSVGKHSYQHTTGSSSKVFLVLWEVQENVPRIPCRVRQPRFAIKLDWSELQEQGLPLTVIEVHCRTMSFGRSA